MRTRNELGALALVTLTSAGCTTSQQPRPAEPGPSSHRPARVEDRTISGAEAAAVLRRAATERAFGRPADETSLRDAELAALLADARGRPGEDALRDRIDRHLLARTSSAEPEPTIELRTMLAHAWLDRGERERAAAQAERVLRAVGVAPPELRAELHVALGHGDLDAVLVDLLAPHRIPVVRARAAARWGDAGAAAAAVPSLHPVDRCTIAVSLASRHRRDGDVAATRWLDVAEEAQRAIAPPDDDELVACTSELAVEAQVAADRERAARALAAIEGRSTYVVCRLLLATAERLDPSLLDVPLAVGVAVEEANPETTGSGCAAIMSEVAARRGDQRVAARLHARAFADTEPFLEASGYDRRWNTGVRLGRVDPTELGRGVMRPLSLARIYDEQPEARVDAARLEASLSAPRPSPGAAKH